MPSKAAQNIYRLLMAMLIVAFLLADCPVVFAQGQGAKTLVLTQVSDVYGHITSYINHGAIKIVVGGGNVYLVSAAPNWKVMFCNDTNKKALIMSLPQWLQHLPSMTYAASDWDRFRISVVRSNQVKRDGRVLQRYFYVPEDQRVAAVSSPSALGLEYFVLATDSAAKEACLIMEKALSCPKITGIPVDLINHKKKAAVTGFTRSLGGDDHCLTTSKIEERVMPPAFFAYPANYKIGRSEAEVVDDKVRREHIDGLVKDLLPDP